MSVFGELWKIVTAAWADLAKSLYCIFLKARLKQVNLEIEFATNYVKNAENGGATMFANYFRQKIPQLTAEREGLEADLETSGCKEKS